jgi:hypothetical protein
MADLNASVVILVTILGAAAAVTIGYAFARLLGRVDPNEDAVREPSQSQVEYMRKVRHTNRLGLYHASGNRGSRGRGEEVYGDGQGQGL